MALMSVVVSAGQYNGQTISPTTLLAAARFGEAQLYGLSDQDFILIMVELTTGHFRTHDEWRDTLLRQYIEDPAERARQRLTMERDKVNSEYVLCRPIQGQPEGVEFLTVNGTRLRHFAQQASRELANIVREARPGTITARRQQAITEFLSMKELKEADRSCTICFEPTEGYCATMDAEVIEGKSHHHPVKTVCGHIFGLTCLDRWMSLSSGCPICRRTLWVSKRGADGN
jgi:hypothetical protein